jgi:cell division transport system permease protein
MNIWLMQHAQAAALVLRQFARTPVATLLTVLVIGVSLSLPAGLYALLKSFHDLAGHAHGEPRLTLVLSAKADDAAIKAIADNLEKRHEVAEHHFISRDQALRELSTQAGLDDITAGLEKNPLPDVFTVRPAADGADDILRLQQELRQLPGVESTLLDEAWVRRLDALLALGHKAVLILAVLLGFALVVITGNTIRLQILSQRDEIEVSKLIGATDPFVRRPFLYHGALQGLAGGGIAWLIVAAAFHLLNDGIAQLAALYSLNFHLAIPAAADILALLLFATLLGWLGAFLSVGRHLDEIGRN